MFKLNCSSSFLNSASSSRITLRSATMAITQFARLALVALALSALSLPSWAGTGKTFPPTEEGKKACDTAASPYVVSKWEGERPVWAKRAELHVLKKGQCVIMNVSRKGVDTTSSGLGDYRYVFQAKGTRYIRNPEDSAWYNETCLNHTDLEIQDDQSAAPAPAASAACTTNCDPIKPVCGDDEEHSVEGGQHVCTKKRTVLRRTEVTYLDSVSVRVEKLPPPTVPAQDPRVNHQPGCQTCQITSRPAATSVSDGGGVTYLCEGGLKKHSDETIYFRATPGSNWTKVGKEDVITSLSGNCTCRGIYQLMTNPAKAGLRQRILESS